MALQSNALTTVAVVKTFLGIAVDTEDDFIERMINVYSQKIENYCNRKFASATYTSEKYRGQGTDTLQLENYPVTDLASIYVDDVLLETDDYELMGGEGTSNTGEVNKESLWDRAGVRQQVSDEEIFPTYNIKATYTAGYVLPQDGGTRTLPYDLEQCCIDMVRYARLTRYEVRGVRREKNLEASIDYGNNQLSKDSGLLVEVENTLIGGGYVRVVL